MVSLTKEQKSILLTLQTWYKKGAKSGYVTLGGYAGTGKTTLISYLSEYLHKRNKKIKIAFCAYTGKAANVLKEKLLNTKSVYSKDNISTIHSLIYSPIENKKGFITGWKLKDTIYYDLIIIDEASMLDSKIWGDLLSFNVPIIAVGDHGQLPPIEGEFSLLENPQLKLESIHRQARDNPIIQLSIRAREEGYLPYGKFGENAVKIYKKNNNNKDKIETLLKNYNSQTLVLCGYNITRNKLNKYIRQQLGFEFDEPLKGDRVICLRNNHEKEIFNGMLGTIETIRESSEDDWYSVVFNMDGDFLYKGLVYKPQFNNRESFNFTKQRKKTLAGDLFDFGYALTVHKAQGSQAKRVVLFEERFSKMSDEEWRRWLYTAVTRAEEELYIIA